MPRLLLGGTMMNVWLRRLLVLGWIPTLFIVSGFRWVTDQSVVAQERTPIVVTRIYTGDDGKTHAENYEVPLNSPRGATAVSYTHLPLPTPPYV